MFQGVLFGSFSESYRNQKEKGVHDRKESQLWWNFLNQRIEDISTEYLMYTVPDHPVQRAVFRFINNQEMDLVFFSVITLNTLILAMNYSDASESYNMFLYVTNMILTFFFFVELLLKLISNGVLSFFHGAWNSLDLVVFAISVYDIFFESRSSYLIAFQILRFMKLLKMARY